MLATWKSLVGEDVLQSVVDLAEDAGRSEHDPDQERRRRSVTMPRHSRRGTTASRPTRSRCRRASGAPAWWPTLRCTSARSLSATCSLRRTRPSGRLRAVSSPATSSAASSASWTSRLRSLFRAIAMIRSSSSNRAKTTPMVSRPLAGPRPRQSVPPCRWQEPRGPRRPRSTIRPPARSPRSSFSLATLMPSPPRPCRPVLVDGGALRVAALGDDEHEAASSATTDADSRLSSVAELHALHAGGGAAHRAQRLIRRR